MMKRNYFGKFLAIAMIFAGFSLVSCDENDNAIINGQVWVKPEVKLVDGGAIVTGSSTADINRMLSRVRQEIMEAADQGEKFTIDIQTPVLNSTAADNTLNIAAVTGGDIVLNLPSNIVTEVPLMIQALGVADDAPAAPSDNEVEINIPSGSSNIDLGINLPTSTVTLKGGTVNELIAKTGWGTLIIESGVTVNWLNINGGNAVVKDGGKVLGALMDDDFDVKKEGIKVDDLYKNEIPSGSPTDDDFFYVNKAKIIKKDNGGRVYFDVWQYSEDPKNEVEIVISDGARVDTWVSNSTANYRPTITILGEGDAKMMLYGYKNGDGKVYMYSNSLGLAGIKSVSNVTADLTHCLVWNDETQEYEELEVDEDYDTYVYVPQNAKDCKFYATEYINADGIQNNCILSSNRIYAVNPKSENTTYKGSNISLSDNISGNSATIKNCKFEGAEDNSTTNIIFPYQTSDRKKFDFTVSGCEFAKNVKIATEFTYDERWMDKDGNPVTDAYYWWILDENGEPITTDWACRQFSTSLDDVPAKNKENGLNSWYDGYFEEHNDYGIWKPFQYKDYTANLTFENSKYDGQPFTDKTDFIGYVGTGVATDGNPGTKTYFVIDGKKYEAVYVANTEKWRLVEAE
jgi:hypothetical protein